MHVKYKLKQPLHMPYEIIVIFKVIKISLIILRVITSNSLKYKSSMIFMYNLDLKR